MRPSAEWWGIRSMTNNVFVGPNALSRFLDPDEQAPTPLVELPERLNPYANRGVRIFAKLLYLSPLFNLKSLPVLNMLRSASDRLAQVHTIVENSSGNTAFSLAIMARLFGIASVIAIVPLDIAPGKLELLRLAGVDVRFESGKVSGVEMARDLGCLPGHCNLDQYSNPANVQAHAMWTARQVWEQTEGALTIYATALGTTGTALGAVQFFRERGCAVDVVGVYVAEGSAIPGVRSLERLEAVSFDWKSQVQNRVPADTAESYRRSLELCRAGLMGGPSSGLALAGLFRFLEQNPDLDKFRNAQNDVIAAFICCDTPFPYLDKYSTILDPEDLAAA